jgi:Common central domain of tyrosinase
MKPIPMTRRSALRNAAAVIAAAAASQILPRSGNAAGPIRMRKNIEKLSAPELAAYKHAMKIVKDRGKADPNDPKGYDFWAALHDLFDESIHSGCAHFSEKFFPWHRRYLFDFEAVLQQSDPPVTADVMIPYWDWTVPPIQGAHFPSAFEDTGSVLFDATRFNMTPPPWDAAKIRAMVQEKDWNVFAGKPDPSNLFGNNPGTVEHGPHNTLHTNISDDMANPESAVQDPIFWSFHAGIDLVWSRWQRLHVSDTKPQPFADPAATLFFQDRTFTVGSTANTADFSYAYDYDFTADGPPAAAPVVMAASASITAAARSVTQLTPGAVKGRDLTMAAPAAPPASTLLRLADVKVFHDRSYRLNLYLHPKDVDLSTLSADARQAYSMSTITLWKAHHDGAVELFVRPTPPEQAHLGEGWVVTVQSEDIVSPRAAAPAGGVAAPAAVAVRPALPATSDLIRGIEIQER